MLRNVFITVDYFTVLAVLSSSFCSFITTVPILNYFKQNQRLRIYLFIRNIDRNVQ